MDFNDLAKSLAPPITNHDVQHLFDEAARKNKAVDSTNFLADVQRASLASGFAERLIAALQTIPCERRIGTSCCSASWTPRS